MIKMIRLHMRLREITDLVANTSDPSFVVDGSGCIAAWNSAAEAMFALSAGDAIGKQCHEIVQGTDVRGRVCAPNCAIQQAMREDQAVGNFDLRVQTTKGMQWCNVSVLITHGEDATTRYSIHIIHSIDAGRRFESLARDFVAIGTGLLAEQAAVPVSASRSPAHETELSARELDVLKLLAKGVTITAVAEQLHLSRTTVKNHVAHILRKLDSHTRLDAIRRAERAGLI